METEQQRVWEITGYASLEAGGDGVDTARPRAERADDLGHALGPSVPMILAIARKKLYDGIHPRAKSGQNPRVLNRRNLKKAKMKGRKGGGLHCPRWRPPGHLDVLLQ